MDQLIIALALFIGMVVSWLMLPGGKPANKRYEETEALSQSAA
ncbi:MAG: hypothetical protein M5U01_20870 [Ardenticatenaceae bacterium]|nr:hypothetical protein [Ardenticatenaceae bacterium]